MGEGVSSGFGFSFTSPRTALEIVMSKACLVDAIGIPGLLYAPKLVVLRGGIGPHDWLRDTAERFLKENRLANGKLRTSSVGLQTQFFGAIAVSLTAIEADLRC
jgi:hypothetical protein